MLREDIGCWFEQRIPQVYIRGKKGVAISLKIVDVGCSLLLPFLNDFLIKNIQRITGTR